MNDVVSGALTPEQQALVSMAHPFIEPMARKVRDPVGALTVTDLVSIGQEALVDCAREYDAGEGVPFGAYAALKVRWAMVDGYRGERVQRRNVRRLSRAAGLFGQRDPGQHDSSAIEGSPEGLESIAGSRDDDTEKVAALGAYRFAIDRLHEAYASLPERESRLIRLHYYERRSFDAIAKELQLSRPSVRRCHESVMKRLRQRLRAMGVEEAPSPEGRPS